jgi:hypothetical protein
MAGSQSKYVNFCEGLNFVTLDTEFSGIVMADKRFSQNKGLDYVYTRASTGFNDASSSDG